MLCVLNLYSDEYQFKDLGAGDLQESPDHTSRITDVEIWTLNKKIEYVFFLPYYRWIKVIFAQDP